jgi:tetratricopeptide (TPR) repeat protein
MGSKSMALKALDAKKLRVDIIKLLGAMGDTERALQLTELYAQQAKEPQWALLAGGDAARGAGDFQKALHYYQRALDSQPLVNADYDHRIRSRAEQSIEAIRLFELLDPSKIPNGRYVDASQGYEGAVEVTVTVRDGRIEVVEVTDHHEKQFYSALIFGIERRAAADRGQTERQEYRRDQSRHDHR